MYNNFVAIDAWNTFFQRGALLLPILIGRALARLAAPALDHACGTPAVCGVGEVAPRALAACSRVRERAVLERAGASVAEAVTLAPRRVPALLAREIAGSLVYEATRLVFDAFLV